MNEAMNKFIQKKHDFIFNSLSPINEKLKKRLDEMFSEREMQQMGKINNLHCLLYLMNRFVDFLYK
jgi:hypothetical protein